MQWINYLLIRCYINFSLFFSVSFSAAHICFICDPTESHIRILNAKWRYFAYQVKKLVGKIFEAPPCLIMVFFLAVTTNYVYNSHIIICGFGISFRDKYYYICLETNFTH